MKFDGKEDGSKISTASTMRRELFRPAWVFCGRGARLLVSFLFLFCLFVFRYWRARRGSPVGDLQLEGSGIST